MVWCCCLGSVHPREHQARGEGEEARRISSRTSIPTIRNLLSVAVGRDITNRWDQQHDIILLISVPLLFIYSLFTFEWWIAFLHCEVHRHTHTNIHRASSGYASCRMTIRCTFQMLPSISYLYSCILFSIFSLTSVWSVDFRCFFDFIYVLPLHFILTIFLLLLLCEIFESNHKNSIFISSLCSTKYNLKMQSLWLAFPATLLQWSNG